MRVEKLPFTIYDIVGYFLPGAILLASIAFVAFPDVLTNFYKQDWSKTPVVGSLVIGILAATISYALGYCIAIIASKGIEDPIIAAFNYPSEFLIHGSDCLKNKSHDEVPRLWKFFLLHYLLTPPKQNIDTLHPEAAPSAAGLRGWVRWVFGWVPCLRHWARKQFECIFVKQLCDPVIKELDKRFERKLLGRRDKLKGKEWFKIVEYYVMNNNPEAFARMYNYMTMYGFCRNLSAALYISAIILLAGIIAQPVLSLVDSSWPSLSFSVGFRVFVASILLFPLSCMLAANFAKFYLRYSQEAVYAFVTTKETVTTNETIGDSEKSSDSESQNSDKTEVHPIQAAA